MLFLFDILPLEDIIHETIMPMLDYESRVVLNRCFAPSERCIRRFSKDEIIRHEIYVVTRILKNKIEKIENPTGRTRKQQIKKQSQLLIQLLDCFEPGSRKLLIMQHYPKFKQVVIQKLIGLSDPTSDPTSDHLLGASRYFRKKIGDLSKKLLPHIQSILPSPILIRNTVKPIVVKGF